MKPAAFALLLLSFVAPAAAQSDGSWIPESATVLQLDNALKHMHPPALGGRKAGPLDGYARYYTGLTQAGRKVVYGAFVSDNPAHFPPGLYIVDARRMPGMTGGGCTHLRVWYDVETARVLAFQCAGPG